jgi:hypothetical protein
MQNDSMVRTTGNTYFDLSSCFAGGPLGMLGAHHIVRWQGTAASCSSSSTILCAHSATAAILQLDSSAL